MLPNITIGLDDRTYEVLTALAHALTGMSSNGNPASVLMAGAAEAPAMTAKSSVPKPEATPAKEKAWPAPEPAPAAEKTVTLADVRAAITAAVKKEPSNKAQVLAILGDFGAQNASTLDEEHFADLVTRVNEL